LEDVAMRRDVAEEIIRLMKASDALFNDLTLIAAEIEEEAERKKVRRALAELCVDIHEKITLHVVKQYPDPASRQKRADTHHA
jgi:hypothetical protein